MSVFRVYFFNTKTREEVKTPFTGMTWLQTSGGVKRPDGSFDTKTCTCVRVARYADSHRIVGERTLTAADFDFPVTIKVWAPGDTDWRKLVSGTTEVR